MRRVLGSGNVASDADPALLPGEFVLQRSDGRAWSDALADIIADTVSIRPDYRANLERLDRVVRLARDDLRAHPLPKYAINVGPDSPSRLEPIIFASYLVSHRAERLFQLVELTAGTLHHLERRSLQMAIIAARALFETAIVSRRTHGALEGVWRSAHGHRDLVRCTASDADGPLWAALYKARSATRASYQEAGGWPSATSVMTHLDALTKGNDEFGTTVRDLYADLCDATHPNIEASGVYWRTAPSDADGRSRVELAPGRSHSPLQGRALQAVGWSLFSILPLCRDLWWVAAETTLAHEFNPSDVAELGLPRRTGRNEVCCCGSGRKSKVCDHPEPPLPSTELAPT